MREIVEAVREWMDEGEQVALASVVQTWGSSPRRVGAKMAMTPGGRIAGSVSGGCVEAAVFEAGVETIQKGRPQLLKYGVSDESAWEVGLACGGKIEIFVQPMEREWFERILQETQADRRFATAIVIGGPEELLGKKVFLGEEERVNGAKDGLEVMLSEKARPALEAGEPGVFLLEWEEQPLEVFVDVVTELPRLIIVGGAHISVALAELAKTSGFSVTVIDPRKAFASRERFPHVDQLIAGWPEEALKEMKLNRETALAMLTHDPKIDDPALMIALNSPAFYVGALGSQKTQAARRQRLMENGLSEEQLNRLYGPIGMDLGAETPEEIALAIMAQIVAARRGKVKPTAEGREGMSHAQAL